MTEQMKLQRTALAPLTGMADLVDEMSKVDDSGSLPYAKVVEWIDRAKELNG